jgi:acetone carboxylase gamma subunit
MYDKVLLYLKNNWRDILSVIVVILLIICSIIAHYNLGMLIGFLILFILLSLDNIKRIIFDFNVKKIFGIEFGEFEKETIKAKVREELIKGGSKLSDDEINVVTETALNQIIGVTNKSRYYKEIVYYALKDLNVDFAKESILPFDPFIRLDFVVKLTGDRLLAIECAYSESRYLPIVKIKYVIETVNMFKNLKNVSHFLIVTNTQVKEEDKQKLQSQRLPIDVVDNVVTPDGVLSRIQEYLFKIDKNRIG